MRYRDRVRKAHLVLPWVIPASCESCADCVNICPVHGLEMWEGDYADFLIPWLSNPDACIGCGKCEDACTWGAINMTTYVEEARKRLFLNRPKGLFEHLEKRKFNLREAASEEKIIIVLCIDARLNVEDVLQEHRANAYVLRNAGGVIGESEIRSIALAVDLLGVSKIYLIGHRDCRMREVDLKALRTSLENKGVVDKEDRKGFRQWVDLHPDPEEGILAQADRLRASRLAKAGVWIHGLMFEEFTGNLYKIF
ncbi:MAG: 4Fe-4S dicluster domain-containing protein [Nitrospirota bacterium]